MALDRISRIQAEASPPTVRKAAIVSEQLGRRYNILYASVASGDPVGLTEIARWHAGLGMETRAWFDSAEPLTWLKHLDRHGKRRSQWHVSALIVEEYTKFKKGTSSSTHLPQSPAASSSLETPPSQYRLKSTARQSPPPGSSPSTSLSRLRSSDGHLSFGPLVANSHDSLGNSQTRGEKARGWRRSVPAFFDSASANVTPSPYHHRNFSGGLSPASSRLNFPDIIHRFRRQPAEDEEGSSSPLGSQSEDQNDSAPSGPRRKSKRKNQSHLQSPQETAAETNVSNNILDVHAVAPLSAESQAFPSYPQEETVVLEGTLPDAIISQSTPLQRKHPYRSTSLPVMPGVHETPPESTGELDEEDQLETEYELRARCALAMYFLTLLLLTPSKDTGGIEEPQSQAPSSNAASCC